MLTDGDISQICHFEFSP